MKREFVFAFGFAAAVIAMPALFLMDAGCKKTNEPFGIYAPNGLDVPSPTPLPLSGAIVVNVSDGPSVVPNLTILAIEPGNAITLTSVTNGGGQASFNPSVLPPGVWTIQVPTQTNPISNYDLSQQFVTIGPGFTNASINFVPGAFYATLTADVGNAYPTTLQNNLVYTLAVSQSGNLNVPETYSFSGMPFDVVPGPTTLDLNAPSQTVTVQIPPCTPLEPAFYSMFNRTGGTASQSLADSNSVTIQRGYPVTVTSLTHAEALNCVETGVTAHGVTEYAATSINDTWEIDTSGGCTGRPFHVHINFYSTNDSSSSSPSSEDFILYSNTPYTFNWTPTTTSPVNFAWTVTDNGNSANTWSGNFTFDPHYQYGGSCSCSPESGFDNFTGCIGTTALAPFNNLVLNP